MASQLLIWAQRGTSLSSDTGNCSVQAEVWLRVTTFHDSRFHGFLTTNSLGVHWMSLSSHLYNYAHMCSGSWWRWGWWNIDQELWKNWLVVSLGLGWWKKRKWVCLCIMVFMKFHCTTCRSDALDPYQKFMAFYTRSENPFVNYYVVLDAGIAWETSEFSDLSRDQCVLFLIF